MTKSRFNLRNVAKIGVTCLVVCMMFLGCGGKDKDKDDDKGGGNAAGQVELNGKKYPLNKGSVLITDGEGHSEYWLRFEGANNVSCVFVFWTAKGSELPAGTFTTFQMPPQVCVHDSGFDCSMTSNTPNLEIKKSGSDYEITFTGKALFELGDPTYDFKVTWKGKIETTKL